MAGLSLHYTVCASLPQHHYHVFFFPWLIIVVNTAKVALTAHSQRLFFTMLEYGSSNATLNSD